jgi:hypothetical protein
MSIHDENTASMSNLICYMLYFHEFVTVNVDVRAFNTHGVAHAGVGPFKESIAMGFHAHVSTGIDKSERCGRQVTKMLYAEGDCMIGVHT